MQGFTPIMNEIGYKRYFYLKIGFLLRFCGKGNIKRNTVQNILSNKANIEHDISKFKKFAEVHSLKLSKIFNKCVSEANIPHNSSCHKQRHFTKVILLIRKIIYPSGLHRISQRFKRLICTEYMNL